MLGTYRESDPEKIVFGLEADRDKKSQTIPYILKLPFKQPNQVSADQAKSMMDNENALVLDARKQKDYQQSHIEGALYVDNNSINDIINQTGKDETIICYCYKGISSKGFCRKLTRAGFKNVYNLKGGYDSWRKISGIKND